MYKYTNIKNVINWLPQGLLEEWTENDIIKVALQGYRANVQNTFINHNHYFCVSRVVDHVADVPLGLRGILDISYSSQKLNPANEENNTSNTLYLRTDFNGRTITVFQAMLFNQVRQYTQAMRYAGQDSDLVHNGCLNLLCQDCINWSIDKSFEKITLDVKEGYVYILYKATIQEDGEFLVPDDPNLFQALAYYVEAKNWLERSYRKEENANNMFTERMLMANNSFTEFNSKHMLRNLDEDNMRWQTQTINQVPQIVYQRGKNIVR